MLPRGRLSKVAHFACFNTQGHAACVSLLLEARADPQPRWPGESPLATALRHGHADCARAVERWR